MKKSLKRRADREQRSMQLYASCTCSGCSACSGCSGTPSWNFNENSTSNSAKKSARDMYI